MHQTMHHGFKTIALVSLRALTLILMENRTEANFYVQKHTLSVSEFFSARKLRLGSLVFVKATNKIARGLTN